jgi:hypothetical protein
MSGGAVLHFIRIDAVETAIILTNIAKLGGKEGPSLKSYHG